MNRTPEIAGIIILIGITQFMLFMKIAEFLYPNYSVANNYISDLGVGPVSYIFNISIILLGILGMIGAYLLFNWNKIFSVLLFISITIYILIRGVWGWTIPKKHEYTTYNSIINNIPFLKHNSNIFI